MGSGRRRKLFKQPGYKRQFKCYHMPTTHPPGLPRIMKKKSE